MIVLLGGGFALAQGSRDSGLDQYLADGFAALAALPPAAVLLLLVRLAARRVPLSMLTRRAALVRAQQRT